MRNFEKAHQISLLSAPELVRELARFYQSPEMRGRKWNKKRITISAIVNSILADFFDWSEEDQVAMVDRGMKRCREVLSRKDGGGGWRSRRGADPAGPGGGAARRGGEEPRDAEVRDRRLSG